MSVFRLSQPYISNSSREILKMIPILDNFWNFIVEFKMHGEYLFSFQLSAVKID